MNVHPAVRSIILLLVIAMGASACGDPEQVTYVDPNGPVAPGQGGSSVEPVARYGVHAIERAKSAVRIRASLTAARTLSTTDKEAAAQTLRSTIEEELPILEPRVAQADGATAATLRSGLERLATTPPASAVKYAIEVRRISDTLLERAAELSVPIAARQDVAFRAAVLYETLLEAGTDYEAAFDGEGERIETPAEYRDAYGLLIDASTRQLEAVPEEYRGPTRATLDKIARRSVPGPTPPEDPRNPETVLGELGALADRVVEYTGIDPTFPTPDAATPDQLRALKGDVAAAVESWERGDRIGALRQLATADERHLLPASPGIAAVSMTILHDVEQGVLIDLPQAMRSNADVVATGAELDAHIDEAVTQVETELEALRDAQ